MNKKNIIGILITSIAVLSLIGFAHYKLSHLNNHYDQLASAERFNSQVHILESAIYHAQLNMLEYVYSPTKEKLLAFEKYNEALSDQVDMFTSFLVINSDISYDGAPTDIEAIRVDIKKIQNDWQEVLTAIEPIRIGKENGESVPVLVPVYKDARVSMIEKDQVFYLASLDERISNIIQKQRSHIEIILTYLGQIKDTINMILLVLAGVYMVLLILIAIWLGAIITKFQPKIEK